MRGTHVIYVPKEATDLGIVPGSGIVGNVVQQYPDRVLIYYEGNVYGAENMRRFVERVYNAADRQVARYPTSAMMAVRRDELIEVGRFDHGQMRVTAITNPAELLRWVPDEVEWVTGFRPGTDEPYNGRGSRNGR